MGGSHSACTHNIKSGQVAWYSPHSDDYDAIVTRESGFGIGRNKSFKEGLKTNIHVNRIGNINGELGGRIIFYQDAHITEDYSTFNQDNVINLKKEPRLYAKAFLDVPPGRLPIGENNLLSKNKVKRLPNELCTKGQGKVLLTMAPRAYAVFVTVDGEKIKPEYLCMESVIEMEKHYKAFQPRPVGFRSAIPGSFLTFLPQREMDEYFFVHLPLVSDHQDTISDAGYYGTQLTAGFCKLLASLPPGQHTINLKFKCYYDHCDYNCFILNKNMNALGQWQSRVSNLQLSEPHPFPQDLVSLHHPIAQGTVTVLIPKGFWPLIECLLDRKPPREVYQDKDREAVRREARVVAAGRFCDSFKLDGLPDVLVLMSGKKEQNMKDEETGYRYKYESVEFAAVWLNQEDSSLTANGIMLEGCMSRGELQPKQNTRSWTWSPLYRAGKISEPVTLPVMNKYIRARIKPESKSSMSG